MLPHMVRLFVRIDFEPIGCAFGPGKAQLLERLSEHGSLRRAAASMGMSYRTAWLLVEEMQMTFNRAVVTAEQGGIGGGGMQLTELGTVLLKTYRRIEAGVTEANQIDLQDLAAMVQVKAAPRSIAKRARSARARNKHGKLPKKRRR